MTPDEMMALAKTTTVKSAVEGRLEDLPEGVKVVVILTDGHALAWVSTLHKNGAIVAMADAMRKEVS